MNVHSLNTGARSARYLRITSRWSFDAVVMITDIASRSEASHLATSSAGDFGRVGLINALFFVSVGSGRGSMTRAWSAAPVRTEMMAISQSGKLSCVRIGRQWWPLVIVASASDIARAYTRGRIIE